MIEKYIVFDAGFSIEKAGEPLLQDQRPGKPDWTIVMHENDACRLLRSEGEGATQPY